MTIIIVLVFLIPIYAQAESDDSYILTLNTENSKYIPGQSPVIFGNVFDENNNPATSKIHISITNDNGDVVYETSTLAKDGKFRHVGFSPEITGKYFISAYVEDKSKASTEIFVQEFYETKFGLGTFATIVSIFILLCIIGSSSKSMPVTKSEPARFALLTMCSLIPIITLIATDVQIGQDGVSGLVLQELPANSNAQDNFTFLSSNSNVNHFKWVMHFGGNVHDNYQSGITVPIYILFFGMIGGYLRFLYKTQRGWFLERAKYELRRSNPSYSEQQILEKVEEKYENVETHGEDNDPVAKRIIFNNSMQDLSLIFLPPILAVASYFLLLQGGVDENNALPTFAIVSFAIGLISNEIINRLESIARSTIDVQNNGHQNKDPPNNTAPNNSKQPI